MQLHFQCLSCNLNQVLRIIDILAIERGVGERLLSEVLVFLSRVDYQQCNPEVMGGVWRIILRYCASPDPYADIKSFFNSELMKINKEIEASIAASEDAFTKALRIAIIGNLIDFAAQHHFSLETLKEQLASADQLHPAIDDSESLRRELMQASTLLYLGDNCGEIVLDKLFIQQIRLRNPQLQITYGVRGKPIVNDITRIDALMVNMQECATIIDNGDDSLGTVLPRTSSAFRQAFYAADIIIAKGQGNFESLSEVQRGNIFHLLMAKCQPVAKLLDVEPLSILCLRNRYPR